jgi:ABC-type sugar transport system ATPase subunit
VIHEREIEIDDISERGTQVRPATPLVEARGLSKRYSGGTLAVDHLDLEIKRGEVYGL